MLLRLLEEINELSIDDKLQKNSHVSSKQQPVYTVYGSIYTSLNISANDVMSESFGK